VRTPQRDQLQVFLKEREVDTLIHYPVPVHLQEAYAELGMGPGALPATEQCATQILSLPMSPELTPEQAAFVAKQMREFLTRRQ
jgi:dTDP-4-amino-4,6-dideoxygalactose transaminase